MNTSAATPSKTPLPKDLFASPHPAAIGTVVAIVVSGAMVAVSGLSAWVAVMVAGVVAAVAVTVQMRSAAERASRARTIIEGYRQETDQWQHRWMKLQQEAQQTASALQKMRDGVILLSQPGDILLINPAARRLLGISDESTIEGRRLAEVVRIPEVTGAIAAAGAGDGTQKAQLEVADGEIVRPVKLRVDPITGRTETRLLLTLRDETEANRVDEMRREFVANISHELKTPLAAIKGYAETVDLAIEDDPTAAKHFMSQIHIQCLRLERLIADMMQLARAQAGRAHLKISRVSVDEVIHESLKSYRPVAEAKGIELTIDGDHAAVVTSDREATLTIVNNLIGNAIRYTSYDGHVQVGCRDAGRFVSLYVQDDGVGIPAGEQKRIFERFYRVEKARHSRGDGTSSSTEGTGIGLSIVKNLTVALGGEVRVRSHPGEGSRFEVLLPKADSAETT